MKPLLHAILITLIFTQGMSLWAQPLPEEEEVIELTFRSLLMGGDDERISTIFFIDEKKRRTYIDANMHFLSERTYKYKGLNPIIFYDDSGPIASFEVPKVPEGVERLSDAILFFIPNPVQEPGKPAYIVYAMDNSHKAYPPGSYLLMNFTKRRVAARIGDRNVELRPGQQQLVTLTFGENRNIAARFWEEIDGEWVRSYQVAWYYRHTARQMVFLTQNNDRRGTMSIRMVSDWGRPPPPPEPETEDAAQSTSR